MTEFEIWEVTNSTNPYIPDGWYGRDGVTLFGPKQTRQEIVMQMEAIHGTNWDSELTNSQPFQQLSL